MSINIFNFYINIINITFNYMHIVRIYFQKKKKT